ncbi:phosphotransferase [Actinoplanes sp. NPDC049118]|uniref:phosphotransferase n=1 Tax=Actinoplanes sp. NPDC049118 TaxID=3155769 RepID=UPI00340B52AD
MTDVPPIPAAVLANVQQRWPDVAESWAGRAGAELRALCDLYQATPRAVLPARYGFVVAVETPDGPLVLRGSPDPHGPDQAAVATALAGLGISPTVRQTLTFDHGTWTVLDRVQPGTSLYQADPSTVSLEALFVPLAAMRYQPPPHAEMPSLIDWLRSRLEADHLIDLRAGATVAPPGDREAALMELAELARDHTPGLCHADASLGNIIASGTCEWKYIDPRGMAGECAYDVAVLAIRVARFRDSPGLVRHVAKLAEVAPERVEAWMTIADTARV